MRYLRPSLASVALAALALTALSVQPVAAQTVTINYARTYNTFENRVIVAFDSSFTNQGNTVNTVSDYAGSQSVTIPGYTPSPAAAYCVDILGVLGQNPNVPYDVTIRDSSFINTGNPNVSNALHGGAAAWLVKNTVVSDNRDSAALQLAIWESLYDWNGTTFNTLAAGNIALADQSGGNFQYLYTPASGSIDGSQADAALTVDIFNRANTILLNWGGRLDSATYLDTNDVTGPSQPPEGIARQDLITVVTSSGVAPEPGALALLAPVFLGGLMARRRKNK